jgi:hypothetical protein
VLEGIEATMFRTIGDGPSPWESLLPPELLRLPAELARVDALLDNPVFFGSGAGRALARSTSPRQVPTVCTAPSGSTSATWSPAPGN